MEVKIETSEQMIPVIIPLGEIDMHESPKLREVLLAEIAKAPQHLIVDLCQTTFVDSSGVATLVEAMKGLNSIGAKLLLCGMSAKVLDVFELSRLDKIFNILPTRTDAVARACSSAKGTQN